MNTIVIKAVTKNGKDTLANYCMEAKNKKLNWVERRVKQLLPYTEEVDNLQEPTKITVVISKAFESHTHIILPKVSKSVLNILEKFGGKPKDFKVTIQ